MKQTVLTLFGIALAASILANGRYEAAMGKNIPAVFSSASPEELQGVINQLVRIGEAEGDKWQPYYYSAFGYIKMSEMYESPEDTDKYLALAIAEVEKGLAVDEKNSELVALKGYCYMMQLVVDPQTRGMTHSGLAFEAFNKAIALDPANPRAYYLLGKMQEGTAKFMGSGVEEACETLTKALNVYENGVSTNDPFAPQWGHKETASSIAQICGK